MDKKTVKMIVAATNSNGEPDLYLCEVYCTIEQINTGEHYDLAREKAEINGFEPHLVFDEFDARENKFLYADKWINSKDSID